MAQLKQYPNPIRKDAALSVSTALGANNATTSTAAIDLGAEKPYPTSILVQVDVTASANGANSKNVNISIQHSDVNLAANFANIAELTPMVNAMNVAALPASSSVRTLQTTGKRFVRLLCVTENAGGAPNDATATLTAIF